MLLRISHFLKRVTTYEGCWEVFSEVNWLGQKLSFVQSSGIWPYSSTQRVVMTGAESRARVDLSLNVDVVPLLPL